MGLSLKNKLYVQLQPDLSSRDGIIELQRNLPNSRPVPSSELHMTIIHLGELARFERSIPEITISDDELCSAAAALSTRWNTLLTRSKDEYELTSNKLSLFGKQQSALVVEYDSSPELIHLHSLCLQELMVFLSDVGISDPDTFIQNDSNLKHSRSLSPHVTLFKKIHTQNDMQLDRLTTRFTAMKTVY
jgi:2'-5' RNA ligase